MHSGNGEAAEMYAAGTACFAATLADVGVSAGPVRDRMRAWWADSTERMDAYPHSCDDVPPGLTIPRWSG